MRHPDPHAWPAVTVTGADVADTLVATLRQAASEHLAASGEAPRPDRVLDETALHTGPGRLVRQEARRLGRFGRFIGTSEVMLAVYELIARVAPTDASVLITGETGTGKEVAALTLHAMSARARKPFVPMDCGSVPSALIESAMFGHERGAFTGAERMHRGHFERAHLGTLFLDEITETTPELQVNLLRVLETGHVTRVGGEHPLPVDVRIVAATNRPVDEAVSSGRLRKDLLYRLNVFPIALPPLRARGDDVLLLADHFLRELGGAGGPTRFTAAGRERMRRHEWPGNVRELKNAVLRSFILAGGKPEADVLAPSEADHEPAANLLMRVATPLAESERRLVMAALELFSGNLADTAAALGIEPGDLRARLRGYAAR